MMETDEKEIRKSDSDIDSQSDLKPVDCIKVTANGTEKPAKQKRKRQKTINDMESNATKKQRPNYFIGIQISNTAILGKILALQNFITSLDSRFSKSVVPIATTHITLAVLSLIDEETISRVMKILDETREQIWAILKANELEFCLEKLGHFNNEVLFVNISSGEGLEKLTQISKLLVNSCSEYCSDGKAFKPHVTVMKLSKLHGSRKKKVRKISPYLYSDLNDHSFGIEKAANLQLLSMLKKKQANGYYHSEYTLNFGSAKQRSEEKNRWSLRNWADCVAVSCITSALYLSNSTLLGSFSNFISGQIIQDGFKSYNKTQLLKRSKKNDKIRAKVSDLKRVLAREETKQLIREELGVA